MLQIRYTTDIIISSEVETSVENPTTNSLLFVVIYHHTLIVSVIIMWTLQSISLYSDASVHVTSTLPKLRRRRRNLSQLPACSLVKRPNVQHTISLSHTHRHTLSVIGHFSHTSGVHRCLGQSLLNVDFFQPHNRASYYTKLYFQGTFFKRHT